MYYRASSIKAALQQNSSLSVAGLEDLRCPQTNPTWVGVKSNKCCQTPQSCNLALSQKCEQQIHIYKDRALLAILYFNFTISKNDNDGFIDGQDSTLGRLIDKGFINAKILKTA